MEFTNRGGFEETPVLRQVMYIAYPHDKRLHLHSRYGAHMVRLGDDWLLKIGILNGSIRKFFKFSSHAPSGRIFSGQES